MPVRVYFYYLSLHCLSSAIGLSDSRSGTEGRGQYLCRGGRRMFETILQGYLSERGFFEKRLIDAKLSLTKFIEL